MSVKIIIDSTVDVSEKYSSEFTVVPLTVSFGETDYIDGVTIDKQTFYEKLVTSKELPKTSQATPDAFIKVFKEFKDRGEEAVVITVSSRLSGTYQSACIAAEDFPNIRVVDSMNVSIASGILAEYALRCAAEGMGLDELAALAGGVLNIKPVVTTRDGELAVLGKARGSKKANNLLVEQITRDGVNYSMPLQLGYTGLSDDMLQQYIEDSQSLWKGHVSSLDCVQLSSVIGTHAGPGAVAVAYFKSGAVQ